VIGFAQTGARHFSFERKVPKRNIRLRAYTRYAGRVFEPKILPRQTRAVSLSARRAQQRSDMARDGNCGDFYFKNTNALNGGKPILEESGTRSNVLTNAKVIASTISCKTMVN